MKNKIKNIFNKYDIELTNLQLDQFEKYYNLVVEWNKKINLTSIVEESDFIYKHLLDSVLPYKCFNKNSSIIDVGSGAGFPAIPLKILRPDLNFTLLDSLNKRINFLNLVIDDLKLEKISTIHDRADDLSRNYVYREKFDYAVARAVANLSTLSEYLLPFVKIDGFMIAYKSILLNEELLNAENAIRILGGKQEDIINFSINEISASRSVVVIKKIDNTPVKYPRDKNKPKIKPL